MSELIQSPYLWQEFKGHKDGIRAVAVFPDKRRMVTGSDDNTLRLWDLKTGDVLKKMEGHRSWVLALTISRDGQLIASGDEGGNIIIWHGETGESLIQPIKAHSTYTTSLNFSPDGTVLATSAYDKTTKLWDIKTWEQYSIKSGSCVYCIRYSPSGELLAIATFDNIEIYELGTRTRVAKFKGHTKYNSSLAWTPDGTRLLTGGDYDDPTIREWDTTTWKQVSDPWTGHSDCINAIAVNSAGTLVASASQDNHVHVWQLSEGQTVATFKHTSWTLCVTFSMDGNYILSGGADNMISKWAVPEGIRSKILASTTARDACIDGNLSTTKNINTDANSHTSYAHRSKILAITSAREACIYGDFSTAEELFTQDIKTYPDNHTSYAHRSFVMAQKHDWNRALQDAIKSISIQPSLTGYISKGIALCGTGHVRSARVAFDVASMYTKQDSQTIYFLLLIKVIALFNADQHDEASLLLKELTTGCPNADTRAYHIVEAYLRIQLGLKALDGTRHNEAAEHFTAALNSNALSSKSGVHDIYEDLVVLFGWNLKSLWLTAHQKRCDALLRADKLLDAIESYRFLMDDIDEKAKASCLEWSNAFTRKCSALVLTRGDAALAANDFERAIDLYSAAIDLSPPSDAVFAKRSQAKLGKMMWMEALLDAQKVIRLDPSSHIGYKLKHAAFHGAQSYDEAITAFKMMLSKLDDTPDAETRKLRQQYLSPSEAELIIQKIIDAQLDNAPLRVLDTTTGLLCDRKAQIGIFKSSIEYMELLSSTITHRDIQAKRIEEVVISCFQYVMLSHRWEGKEPLLQDIQGKVVYELDPVGGIKKLQSFCKTARDLGYRWAWSDTCCIDKNIDVELQASVKSMFAWYHHSALTVVYLSDVPRLSETGALAKSAWNTRGWTVQEFLAPNVILFYQKDWTLYLGDRTPNHKDSVAIMQELEEATGIDRQAVVAFRPGMRDAREKLQWVSTRTTTLQEDIAYSLFGVFGVRLHVDYTEKKQNALGRLLQEIVAQSGDITALDWIGKPSEFNSCLPADITSYKAPPCKLPSLSEDEIQSAVSSLRGVVALQSASKLYQTLDDLSAPRFAHRRLHLPCIVFTVTEARRRPGQIQDTFSYELKSDGLCNLQITTEDKFTPFSLARPPPVWQTILLVRPWSRDLLGLYDTADDTQSVDNWSISQSSSHDSIPAQTGSIDWDSHSRALRLMVRLGQPFNAFLLARQRDGEFKRIASSRDIIAQVKDMTLINYLMDIRILEVFIIEPPPERLIARMNQFSKCTR
ncbi:uncharacterized protein EDB93DRAFT_598081 [Suillus bovinus]|uniref:uncharacterized protein n=1 Tax=Suillus bovinus TaxID=48563 RepID=UPI001B874266|nr:uncharacterized protein EDB93DRAFT_598081 [Suillus bovinus]KAG2142890.1 hypothetical protein EDB93DRAFT_598081 [Suillus bovinus]